MNGVIELRSKWVVDNANNGESAVDEGDRDTDVWIKMGEITRPVDGIKVDD